MRATLTFPIKENKVLLSIKVKKIGAGFWNGYGGKIENESPNEAGARELFEESGGIICEPNKLIPCAVIDFFFHSNETKESNWKVIVYLADDFSGEAVSTPEMINPEWFHFDSVPYDKMLPADHLFLPKILVGEKFTGWIRFTEDMKKVHSYDFKIVDKDFLEI